MIQFFAIVLQALFIPLTCERVGLRGATLQLQKRTAKSGCPT